MQAGPRELAKPMIGRDLGSWGYGSEISRINFFFFLFALRISGYNKISEFGIFHECRLWGNRAGLRHPCRSLWLKGYKYMDIFHVKFANKFFWKMPGLFIFATGSRNQRGHVTHKTSASPLTPTSLLTSACGLSMAALKRADCLQTRTGRWAGWRHVAPPVVSPRLFP